MAFRLSEHLYIQVEPIVENTVLGSSKAIKHIIGVSSMKNYMGFSQDVEVQTGDTIDFVLSQSLKKETITLSLYFNTYHKPDGTEVSAYDNFVSFRNWIVKYSDMNRYRMTLIMGYGDTYPYEPPSGDTESALYGRRIDGYFVDFGKDVSLMEGASIHADLSFKCLSRPYTAHYKNITVTSSSGTKVYKYTYPYKYGFTTMTDNIIENTFMKDVPMKITIHGPASSTSPAVTNPVISLHYANVDDSGTVTAGDQYAEILFSDISIPYGEELVIDANQYLIYQKNGTTNVKTNKYDNTDKANDSFLFAKTGYSLIYMTSSSSSTDMSMDVEYTEYDF